MRKTLEEEVADIVRAAVARHGGGSRIAALSVALAMTGRIERERATAAFAQAASEWGDSLDSYDQRDRVHIGRFVETWEKKVAEQIVDIPDGMKPSTEPSDLESRAVATSFRIAIGTREMLTEDMMIEAAVVFGQREWMLAMTDTARLARGAFQDMERLNVHGNLLHWWADGYAAVAERRAPGAGQTKG